ncbi:MAG: spore coat protein YlbD [Bacilli bacterium]|nr:spore coat protein YlbD [Bacilli bacterium]
MKKEEFKEFVKKNPSLIKYIKNDEMTWQKFYEIYDMYGENNEIWDQYLNKKVTEPVKNVGINEFVTWLKTINLTEIQDGLNSVSRVIGVFQDLGNNKENNIKTEYKPRPLYKHFED